MPRIRCKYMDCIFLEENFCGAAAIDLDPDTGCQTYSQSEETETGESWEEDEELDEDWENEEEGFEIEDEDEEESWDEDEQ
jgi:hypothetical protein